MEKKKDIEVRFETVLKKWYEEFDAAEDKIAFIQKIRVETDEFDKKLKNADNL